MIQLEAEETPVEPGERGLWAAVLQLGVHDAILAVRRLANEPKPRDPSPKYLDALRDQRWLHSSAVYPGSFVWLCTLLDLDPRRLRGIVMERA